MPDLLELRGVEAGYGGKMILRGIDLAVEEGEVVALLGANGSGKSTALNTVSGFVKATSGSISFAGEEIRGRRRIGFSAAESSKSRRRATFSPT